MFDEQFENRNAIMITFSSIQMRTPDAICVDGIWLPRSQIKYEDEGPFKPVEIEMPEWLAYEKELI